MKFDDLKSDIKNLEIIGKGWRGTVYKGLLNGKTLSFKVPNSKEHIRSVLKEGEILKIVNKYNIGGNLEIIGDDFIAYEHINGKPLIDVLNKENYLIIIKQLFWQARILDEIKINKDEMQRPLKNALVDNKLKVYLIDFEKARKSEKVSNITQLLQFVLSLKDFFPYLKKENIITLGKIYKQNPSQKNFIKVMQEVFK